MTTSEDPDTKTRAKLHEPKKAALAECCELHKPKPPNQNGKVACNQPSSDILQLITLLRQARSILKLMLCLDRLLKKSVDWKN